MYALVVRFDLRPGTEDEFDELVEETTARIRAEEPGTLLYLCHRVHGEPSARVFYELYRDDAAFQAHEVAAHVKDSTRDGNPSWRDRNWSSSSTGSAAPARDSRASSEVSMAVGNVPIGERIAILRRRHGWSQAVMAGRLGKSAQWLSYIERGERSADRLSVLVPIAELLGVTVADLTDERPAVVVRDAEHECVRTVRLTLSGVRVRWHGRVRAPGR